MCCNSFRKCLCCKYLCCKLQHSEQELSPQKNENLWRIWEQLHKSRELEISTQWNRVIFLSSFIVLTLTGNAILFYNVFCAGSIKLSSGTSLAGFFAGLMLLVCGAMWLAMTKGSKYWMNVYERKIDLIENELNFDNDYKQFRYLEEKYVGSETKKAADGKLYKVNENLVIDSKPCWLDEDSTSPSKTNVLIGWLLFLLSIVFSTLYIMPMFEFIKNFLSYNTLCAVVLFLVVALVYYCFVHLMLNKLKHGSHK